jgi:hypothetical protein
MYLKMNEKLLTRIRKARTHVKVLNNKIAPRYKSRTSLCVSVIYAILLDMERYVVRNAGVNPPVGNVGDIFHADFQIQSVNDADEALRTIWYLLNEGNQKSLKGQYQAVNNLIDEFRGYLIQLKTRGIWNG